MQLERAQSSEAGLAGWISSNDVTLFTMVLVVVIALFLHTGLLKGRSANEKLTDRNAELRALNQQMEDDLRNTSDRLAAARDDIEEARKERERLDAELAERKRKLQLTEDVLQDTTAQRDDLDERLRKALDRIARLDASVTNLTAKKTELETQRAALGAARDGLARDKATLTEKLAVLTTQLEEKVKALSDAEQQRDRLRKQADSLDAIIATLQKKLNLAAEDVERLKADSAQQLALAKTQIGQLEEKATAETARAEDYLARLHRAADWFKRLQAEKTTLQGEVTELVAREAIVSRKLVGITGKLRRVAFLFDASGSMKQRGTGTGDRWLEAQRIAATWLAHLDVEECVLIVFSSRVRTFPAGGAYLRVSGPEAKTNRALLKKALNSVEPKGLTNTLDAFRTAYRYEGLDTIILLSDGAPSNSTSGKFDPAMAEQIYSLCRQHPNVPVNTIGLGNYFDQNMSTFLRNVARLTKGTFRGR